MVAWRLDLPPELPPLEADPMRLRQVLLNLLHNAHKFTERGQITLGAEVVPPDLHLWVADTGVGISRELQEQIFEPFISVDSSARRHEGIGLGLSIARRLVALHRGRMTVESQPGRGSTFHIRYRVLSAKELLRTTNDTIAQVAARVGFDTATYFSHIFHREVGCSPRAFRAQSPD